MARKAARMDAVYTYAEQTETCAYCQAKPGEQCRVAATGRWRRNPHQARMDAAMASTEAQIAAQALDDAADWLEGMDDGRTGSYREAGRHIIARLRERAKETLR